jgi:hypothetical protein
VAPTPSRLPTGDSPDPSEEEEDGSAEAEDGDDTHPLLAPTNQPTSHGDAPPPPQELDPAQRAALHACSVYKPTAHLFVAGDLNYRIAVTTPPAGAAFPSFDPRSEHYFPKFLARDQLTREREAGRTLYGLSEAGIRFGPTYKFDVLPVAPAGDGAAAAAANGAAGGSGLGIGGGEGESARNREPGNTVPWRFAPHRWPSWCDRVLYLDVPRHVAAASAAGAARQSAIDVRAYDALPVVATSDHRAVFFRARVPVLSAEEMAPPPQPQQQTEEEEEDAVLVGQDVEGEGEGEGRAPQAVLPDPRVRLPVPVDVHAWERRAAARHKELLVGWSALVWSTREGAMLLATALALGVGGWWMWRTW